MFLVWSLFLVWVPPDFFLGVCGPRYPCCRCADVVAGCPLPEFSVVGASLEPTVAVAHDCSWSPWQWLAPATKANAGGVLLPGASSGEKGCKEGPCPSYLMHLPNNGTWPLKAARLPLPTQLVVVTPDFNPFSLFLAGNPNPFPGSGLWSLILSTVTPPAPVTLCLKLGSAGQRQWPFSAGFSPFWLPQTGCCPLFCGSKAAPLLRLISLLVRRLSREREHFLFHSSLGSVSPILISLFFSFFCPT